jgi:hypothetical protein
VPEAVEVQRDLLCDCWGAHAGHGEVLILPHPRGETFWMIVNRRIHAVIMLS